MHNGTVRRIFALAERLEPDRKMVWEWVLHMPIDELGGHTTIELIFTGQGESVVAFLTNAAREEEGATRVSPSPPIGLPRAKCVDESFN
jgi:hypothetical protein